MTGRLNDRQSLWVLLTVVAAMAALLAGLMTARPALAEELPKESVLLLGIANKAIYAALESC
ncbi:MAG: hypothetical protein HP491_10585, partial [Nitrospira sp.]|nr:hypothetical protein [Nitrospira sp.]